LERIALVLLVPNALVVSWKLELVTSTSYLTIPGREVGCKIKDRVKAVSRKVSKSTVTVIPVTVTSWNYKMNITSLLKVIS
jgi:hypothetical protein